ncbi:neuronal acetylcholine receptor subunit alpha-5-like [Argopecten irradians]|uniref:neuronal acetylcholine receptor subunit alpha-5-like n=1 Tax=Argopecten irradians TaxID=31199 RepID=UPI0037177E47
MTVHLSFAVLLTIVSSSLPVNSRTSSYLAVYVISLMIKGTAIVMVTVAQVRLHHRPDSTELSPFFRCIVKMSKRTNTCPRKRVKPIDNKETKTIPPFSDAMNNVVESSPYVATTNNSSDSSQLCSDPHFDEEGNANDIYTWSNVSAALDGFFFCLFSAIDLILVGAFFTALL